jgi:endonuclease/exonuclease/phosphatase (EEP) superfamily protein YafD
VVEFGSAGVPSVVAEVNWAGQRFQLIGTHPLPPGTARYSAERNEQLEKLAEHVRRISGPTVLVGDLNMTPWSPYFTGLLADSGLRDASKGSGVTGSWPAFLPIGRIPIDHCLVSPGVEADPRHAVNIAVRWRSAGQRKGTSLAAPLGSGALFR